MLREVDHGLQSKVSGDCLCSGPGVLLPLGLTEIVILWDTGSEVIANGTCALVQH